MAKLLSLKIDVSKIDKSKLFQGQKGTYLDLTISLNDELDNYGNDVTAWQGQTEEERKNKANRNFLGNGKVFWSSEGTVKQSHKPYEPKEDINTTENLDLPF